MITAKRFLHIDYNFSLNLFCCYLDIRYRNTNSVGEQIKFLFQNFHNIYLIHIYCSYIFLKVKCLHDFKINLNIPLKLYYFKNSIYLHFLCYNQGRALSRESDLTTVNSCNFFLNEWCVTNGSALFVQKEMKVEIFICENLLDCPGS